MQLDIFEHSRDVVLRNAAIDALRRRDPTAATQAAQALAAEYRADPLLPEFGRLCETLRAPLVGPITPNAAGVILIKIEGEITTAAHKVFGASAPAWLAPLWRELATAIANYPFNPDTEALHAAPLLLRGGYWPDAAARVEGITSWRRQPAPLAWMIEARGRTEGFDAIWPLLAELTWMSPPRAQALGARLDLPPLAQLLRGFDAEFEGDGGDDFAWFPAWALIADGRLAEGLRLAQAGADTPAERCARVVLGLLALERQGRHAELVEGRRKLRDAHPSLFARYMQIR